MKKWIYPSEDMAPLKLKNVSPTVCRLLAQRQISQEKAGEYLAEKPMETYDPFLLKNMAQAVELIFKRVDDGSKICIYGDYDADGVTSVSLLLSILGKLTDNLSYYIPSRFDEGYGLNKEAVKTICENGCRLMITVDCGTVSHSEVEYAKELGMDVIVTDHHSVGDAKAPDCVLINPKQEDCKYPFKELAGCGVAFKLSQALQRTAEKVYGKQSPLTKSDLNSVLDLVAIATIGDIVPLVSENRTLVKYGMIKVNGCKRPGLLELVKGTGLTPGQIKSDHIAYIIVPHLNAAGRMLSAKAGVELLTAKTDTAEQRRQLMETVNQLVANNKERKAVQEKTYQDCLLIAEEKHRDDSFLLINAGDAHEGIAGIVAGKLKDRYVRPTALVTVSGEEGEFLKGTGRSIEGINLYELLAHSRDIFEKFGGHAGACGFLLRKERLPELRESLNQLVGQLLKEDQDLFLAKLYIDAVITADELNLRFIDELEKMAPFGHKNEKPLLAVKDVTLSKISYMGDRGQHVRFTGTGSSGKSHGFVMFGSAEDYKELLREGRVVDVAGYASLNVWNNVSKVQFIVSDMK